MLRGLRTVTSRSAGCKGADRGRTRFSAPTGSRIVQAEISEVADEMRLDADETLVLALLQQLMIGRDLIAEKNATREEVKRRFRDGFAEAATAHWSRGEDLPAWAREAAMAIAVDALAPVGACEPNGTGLIAGPTRLLSNRSRSCCWLSPSSHIQPCATLTPLATR